MGTNQLVGVRGRPSLSSSCAIHEHNYAVRDIIGFLMGRRLRVASLSIFLSMGLLSLNVCEIVCKVSKAGLGGNEAVQQMPLHQASSMEHASHDSDAPHQNHGSADGSKGGHSCLALTHPDHSVRPDPTTLGSFIPVSRVDLGGQTMTVLPLLSLYYHSPPGSPGTLRVSLLIPLRI